jgi:hypothetical protein
MYKVKVPLKKDTIRDKVLEFMDGETERCDALLALRVRGSVEEGPPAVSV